MHMQSTYMCIICTLHRMHAQMYGQMYTLICLGHVYKRTLGAQWRPHCFLSQRDDKGVYQQHPGRSRQAGKERAGGNSLHQRLYLQNWLTISWLHTESDKSKHRQ